MSMATVLAGKKDLRREYVWVGTDVRSRPDRDDCMSGHVQGGCAVGDPQTNRNCRAAALRLAQPCSLESTMNIDPALLSAMSALVGALIGGGASLTAAIYTQRYQDRL